MKKGLGIGLGIGLVALLFLGKKALSLKKLGDLLSISPKIKGKPYVSGGLLGYMVVPVDIEFGNRSEEEFQLKIPSAQLLYKNKVVGDIAPNDKQILVKKNAKSLFPTIKFEIPLSKLLTSGIAKDVFWKPNGPSDVAKKMVIKITANANGVSFPLTQSLSGYGLGLVAASERKISPKTHYAHLIAPLGALDRTDPIINRDGGVDKTVAYMKEISRKYKADTENLAIMLKGSNQNETLKNIWEFVYKYIKYEPDSVLFEQLRRPLRTLHDQKGDCDCYSILIASLLINLRIPFKFRVTAYYDKEKFQHVYVIVPTGPIDPSTGKGKYITVDPVVDAFNYEKPFINHKDY